MRIQSWIRIRNLWIRIQETINNGSATLASCAIIYICHTQGFYMKTGVLGAGGHFVTSPEIREYAKSIRICVVN